MKHLMTTGQNANNYFMRRRSFTLAGIIVTVLFYDVSMMFAMN